MICFHEATLAQGAAGALIDKLGRNIGLTDGRTQDHALGAAQPSRLALLGHVLSPQRERGIALAIEVAFVTAQKEVERAVSRNIPHQKGFCDRFPATVCD